MKIVHLSYQYSPQSNPDTWINGFGFFYGIWAELALKNEVVFIDFIDYLGTRTHNGIKHFFLSPKKYNLRLPLALHRFVKGLAPDIVMVHGLMSPVQLVLLRLQLHKQTKIVVQHHAEQPFKHVIKKRIQQLADRGVSAYFFTGKDHAIPWLNAGLIGNGSKVKEIMEVGSVFQPLDKTYARSVLGIPGSHVYLWVGHLNQNKNPLLAAGAFLRFLEKTNSDAVLYMIFQSNALLTDLEDLIAAHPNIAKQVRLVGKVPHDGLVNWFSAADFIISTSSYEGSGVAVCEGMSCGCIPVLSDIPAFRFMAGKAGLLFESGNESALADALMQTSRMNIEQEQEKVLRQYHELLSFKAIASHIQTALSEL